MGPVIAFVVIIAFVGGITYIAHILEKKREAAVQGFAMANGYELDPNAAALAQQYSHFKLFSIGRSRRAKNLFRTSRGADRLAVCDYQYTTGTGKSSTTYHQTVCIVQSPRLQVPHFYARRQVALLDFFGKVFGGQDINFDGDEAFSKAFVLQTSESESALRGLFDERVRMAFTQLAAKNIQVEAKADAVVFHYGKRVQADKMNELIEDALSIRQVFC